MKMTNSKPKTIATGVVCKRALHRTVEVRQVRYQGWDGCWRLSDGEIEVVVVPQVGRIMRFGFVGGRNVLWEHPALPQAVPVDKDQWANPGGDKIWPWPQCQWEPMSGRSWPPPDELNDLPHAARQVNANTVRLASPVLPGWQVRVVRDISISAIDAMVSITSWYAPTEDRAADRAWPEVWSVSQVPPPDGVCVRILEDPSPVPLSRGMVDGPWALEGAGVANWRWLARPANNGRAKVGVQADVIAALFGSDLFVQQCNSGDQARFVEPTDRAQVYAEPESDDPLAYWELEFLGGVHRRGATPLAVSWRMHRLPGGASRERVARTLQDLTAS